MRDAEGEAANWVLRARSAKAARRLTARRTASRK
jgi:hypothetical protein